MTSAQPHRTAVPKPSGDPDTAPAWCSTPRTWPARSPASRTRSSNATRAPTGWCCSGIPTRGVAAGPPASATRIAEIEGAEVPVGSLDVTMYRDDLRLRPARALEHTDIPPAASTARSWSWSTTSCSPAAPSGAALDAIGDVGRPRAVQLAVLVDRGHRELPIRADFVGKNLPTSLRESVAVQVEESTGATPC